MWVFAVGNSGNLICAIMPPFRLAAVFALVGQAVASSFAAVTLIWNAILGRFVLHEVLSPLDYCITALLVAGAVTTVAFGATKDPDQRQAFLTAATINETFARDAVYAFSAVAMVVMIFAVTWIYTVDKRRALHQHVPPWAWSATAWWRPFMAAVLSATTGICSKGFTSLISAIANGSDVPSQLDIWLFLLFLPLSLVLQVAYLNSGLRYFDATLIVPIYQSLIVVMGTVFGFIYWNEGAQLGANAGGFVAGIVVIVIGLSLLLLKRRARPLDDISDTLVSLIDSRMRIKTMRRTLSDNNVMKQAYGYHASHMREVEVIPNSHGRVVGTPRTPDGSDSGIFVGANRPKAQVLRLAIVQGDAGHDVLTFVDIHAEDDEKSSRKPLFRKAKNDAPTKDDSSTGEGDIRKTRSLAKHLSTMLNRAVEPPAKVALKATGGAGEPGSSSGLKGGRSSSAGPTHKRASKQLGGQRSTRSGHADAKPSLIVDMHLPEFAAAMTEPPRDVRMRRFMSALGNSNMHVGPPLPLPAGMLKGSIRPRLPSAWSRSSVRTGTGEGAGGTGAGSSSRSNKRKSTMTNRTTTASNAAGAGIANDMTEKTDRTMTSTDPIRVLEEAGIEMTIVVSAPPSPAGAVSSACKPAITETTVPDGGDDERVPSPLGLHMSPPPEAYPVKPLQDNGLGHDADGAVGAVGVVVTGADQDAGRACTTARDRLDSAASQPSSSVTWTSGRGNTIINRSPTTSVASRSGTAATAVTASFLTPLKTELDAEANSAPQLRGSLASGGSAALSPTSSTAAAAGAVTRSRLGSLNVGVGNRLPRLGSIMDWAPPRTPAIDAAPTPSAATAAGGQLASPQSNKQPSTLMSHAGEGSVGSTRVSISSPSSSSMARKGSLARGRIPSIAAMFDSHEQRDVIIDVSSSASAVPAARQTALSADTLMQQEAARARTLTWGSVRQLTPSHTAAAQSSPEGAAGHAAVTVRSAEPAHSSKPLQSHLSRLSEEGAQTERQQLARHKSAPLEMLHDTSAAAAALAAGPTTSATSTLVSRVRAGTMRMPDQLQMGVGVLPSGFTIPITMGDEVIFDPRLLAAMLRATVVTVRRGSGAR